MQDTITIAPKWDVLVGMRRDELKADYSADPYNHAVLKNSYRSNFTIAGGTTKPAETTNDFKTGNTSPMTHAEKRPARPATGAKTKG
jgi:hypothetical protein